MVMGPLALMALEPVFFHTYWQIVQKNVIDAVQEFIQTEWLLPNYNANSLILIPKNSNVDTLDQFRPIALENFKFKVISKVPVDKHASILPNIISYKQRFQFASMALKKVTSAADKHPP